MPGVKPITIKLDRERKLLLNLDAMERAEDFINEGRSAENEVSIFRYIQDEISKFDTLKAKTIKLILWAALIDDDPELTLKQTGKIVDRLGAMLPVIKRILTRFFTANDENDFVIEDEADTKKKAEPTGLSSGVSDVSN